MKREFVSHFTKVTVLFAPVFFLLFTFPLTGRLWANLGFVALARAMVVPDADITQATRAENLLRRVIAIKADNASVWRGLGFTLAEQGREKKAVEAWRHSNGTTDEFVQRGMTSLYLERDEEAFVWFRRAARLRPDVDNRDALYGLGRVYANRSEWNVAIEVFQRAVGVSEGHVGRSEILYQLGRIYHNLPSPDEERAWQYYEQALDLDEFGDATWAKVETHYRRGQILAARKEWKAAAKEFQAAVALDPTHYWAHILAGNALWRVGERYAAKKMMRRAIALKPDDWHAYQRLGRFFQKEGKIDQSVEMYRKVLELNPQNENALRALESLSFQR